MRASEGLRCCERCGRKNWKNVCVKTLNGNWSILKQKWSLSWIISDSRDSMNQIADELKSNDIDGAHC